jgi:hypothetical protein
VDAVPPGSYHVEVDTGREYFMGEVVVGAHGGSLIMTNEAPAK